MHRKAKTIGLLGGHSGNKRKYWVCLKDFLNRTLKSQPMEKKTINKVDFFKIKRIRSFRKHFISIVRFHFISTRVTVIRKTDNGTGG